MGTKKSNVTAKEVAQLAGVSQTTVSMILNNYENVSFTEETRQKVLNACNTLGYIGSYGGNKKGEKIILVVFPSHDNPSYTEQSSVIYAKALEHGYTCITLNTFRNSKLENNVLMCINTIPLAGVIFLYQPESASLLERIGALKPCVVVCDRNQNVRMDTIEINSYGTGNLIAEYMISLGHKKVAYISASISKKYINRVQRLAGFKHAYMENGFNEDSVRVVAPETEGISPRKITNDIVAGNILTNAALDKYGKEITGIVGYNDMICVGILDALKKRGYQVPKDYSLIGCDNIRLSETDVLSLTTVEIYTHLRARDAVEQLIKKIDSGTNDLTGAYTTGITRVEYTPKIIVRSSTKSIK